MTHQSLRIALAQLNFTVGDLAGNLNKHLRAVEQAVSNQAQVILFSELSLTGYPPEDLLLRPAFVYEAEVALSTLIKATESQPLYVVAGHPYATCKGLFNACSIFYRGQLLGRCMKAILPNEGVFDEHRYFTTQMESICVLPIHHLPVGFMICEDLWHPMPMQRLKQSGAQLIAVLNASPFEVNKHDQRLAMLTQRTAQYELPILYVNQVGGQDELIFDGGSMAVNAEGTLVQCAGFFNETITTIDSQWTKKAVTLMPCQYPPIPQAPEERIYQGLILSIRDYVYKNHFNHVYIGLSGGIDSALTMVLAVEAIGKDHVTAILMPSRYTAAISTEDALALVRASGVKHRIISIEPVFEANLQALSSLFRQYTPDVTEENIQARCRAIILMALSNKTGGLVLTTGNRSELAVGYCTLYGDMAGGFSVLKDIPKTMVYQLAHYYQTIHAIIPERMFTRPPTAELKADQKDEDTLPPYELLDRILYGYLNQSKDIQALIREGFEEETVKKIISLVKKNEYKRRQSPPGPRINYKSFGKEWRYPLTNGY